MVRFRFALLALVLLAAGFGRPAAAQDAAAEARRSAVAMRHVHDGDAPVANAAARAPRRAVSGEEVVYATIDGRAVRGYVARPADAPADAPGIVVVHEWWGLNDNIRMMADRLAGEGYVALAVDLMGGKVATTPDEAMQLYQAAMANVAAGEANVAAAIDWLAAHGATRIATIGWCFGGHWSLRTGLVGGPRVQATVMYYGQPITDADQLARLRSPLLGIFGSQDRGIPEAKVREMEGVLRKEGRTAEIHFFDAGHGFANPSGRAYDARAAEAAWDLTLDFLRKTLGNG